MGSTVDEPETVMEPLTPAGAPVALAPGSLDGAPLGAADDPPLEEQAATVDMAAKATTTRRLVMLILTRMDPPGSDVGLFDTAARSEGPVNVGFSSR
jgi:hypothetical protein